MVDFRSSGPQVRCPCCQIPCIPRSEVARRRVCPGCELHQGNTGMKLDRKNHDHVAAWVNFYDTSVDAERDALTKSTETIDRQRAEIVSLSQKLEDAKYALMSGTATTSVVNWIETERVREADQRADSAYRSRDRLAALLWTLDDLHNDADDDGMCTCGVQTHKCAIWESIADERQFLYRWETGQVERIKQGLPHSLPPEHPEVAKHPRVSWRR